MLITAQSLGRKSFYNFNIKWKINWRKLWNLWQFDGKYTYENGLLTNMIQEIQNKGKGRNKKFFMIQNKEFPELKPIIMEDWFLEIFLREKTKQKLWNNIFLINIIFGQKWK